MNYYIKQCLGPCSGIISSNEYREIFKDVSSFLNGKNKDIIKKLEEEMFEMSAKMDFEKAAKIRDKIQAIKSISERQKIVSSPDDEQDIVAFAKDGDISCAQIFFVREGKLIGREHFIIEDIEETTSGEILATFIKQFYSRGVYIPREILLQEEIEEIEVIEEWLSSQRGLKVYIRIPQKGEKRKLIEMVNKNAKETLQQILIKSMTENKDKDEALMELKELLNLKNRPNKIEAYDISNISGDSSVGSMVVFRNGIKSGRDYRRFKIKSVQGINDYESLKEVLYRRFKLRNDKSNVSKFGELPDLIFVDGGKGHVSSALNILNEIGIKVPVFGLVKDDKHRTRGISDAEKEYIISNASHLFKLISQIQDEAHRYAIDYHRKLRKRNVIASELDAIEGIGERRRINLLKHFKSIDEIRKASIEELAKVNGMSKSLAEQVYKYFH